MVTSSNWTLPPTTGNSGDEDLLAGSAGLEVLLVELDNHDLSGVVAGVAVIGDSGAGLDTDSVDILDVAGIDGGDVVVAGVGADHVVVLAVDGLADVVHE